MPHVTQDQLGLLLAVLGLAGEVGELVDHIKKHVFHGHPLDLDYIQKELGDIAWYWSAAHEVAVLDPGATLYANVAKLLKRYPDGFSHEASLNREE